jgi:hypothetical protein
MCRLKSREKILHDSLSYRSLGVEVKVQYFGDKTLQLVEGVSRDPHNPAILSP